ncbi:arginase-1-like [Gigantopelta aegis]|uniref:arginase-1-like n=1 Tax=Gigantopelta aegis TaxID=1735272 RepID=UPI001B88A62F|nr:arginase-1-like [Gigantopelta aegis]
MSGSYCKSSAVGVIGAPHWKGQPRSGTELAPKYMREAGLIEELRKKGHTVNDYGDITFVDSVSGKDEHTSSNSVTIKNTRSVGQANKQICDKVAKITGRGEICLTLGGDHSIAIGTIIGHAQTNPDLFVVWVDAHGDINTPLTTFSGNLHGMPVSFVLKELSPYMPEVPGLEWCKPCLSVTNLVYVGLRDVDPLERVILDKLNIVCYSMHEVDKFGMAEIMKRIVEASGSKPIHVSFDVDGMDPSFTPSTGTAVPGGLTLRDVSYLAEEIAATGRLAAIDVAEVNPMLGTDEECKKTIATTIEVLRKFLGDKRKGNAIIVHDIPRPSE